MNNEFFHVQLDGCIIAHNLQTRRAKVAEPARQHAARDARTCLGHSPNFPFHFAQLASHINKCQPSKLCRAPSKIASVFRTEGVVFISFSLKFREFYRECRAVDSVFVSRSRCFPQRFISLLPLCSLTLADVHDLELDGDLMELGLRSQLQRQTSRSPGFWTQ